MFRLLILVTFIAFSCASSSARTSIPKKHSPEFFEKKKKSKRDLYLGYLAKALGVIAIPSFVVGEYMMHVNFVKGCYEWMTHGKTARSYFSKNPAGALYCVIVTVRDGAQSPGHSFISKTPADVIKQVDTFLKKSISTDKQLVRIMIEPLIVIEKTGKKITLAPLYCLWNHEKGITHDLEKKFFLTSTTNADNVFEAVKFFTIGSLLSAPLIVALAFAF